MKTEKMHKGFDKVLTKSLCFVMFRLKYELWSKSMRNERYIYESDYKYSEVLDP